MDDLDARCTWRPQAQVSVNTPADLKTSMEHNLRQFFDVVSDYLHDHWVKFATAVLFMAIGWFVGRRRARAEWRRREFFDRLNISLNAVRDGTLMIRTIAEESCSEVFLNSVAVAALTDAARHTTPDDPLLELPEHDYWYYLNAVLNEVAEKFGEGQIRRDMGLPITTARYVICLTSECAGEVRTRKIRAMLIQKSLFLHLPAEEPKFESPNHATRWKTLKYLAAQFPRTPYKFLEVEICV